MILIPETLSPYFATETVQVRHTRRQEEQSDKETLFTGSGFFKPGRNDRNKQIQTDQRIHEPEMPGQCREIQQ